jgi:hypothetical protein
MRPILTLLLAGCLAALALALPPAAPEKPDLDPAALRELATHVATGEVRAIYTRTRREGSWEVTRHAAELAITATEKGEGLASGELVYVRYWTRRWRGWGSPPPSTNGHRGIPAEGDLVRVYLARKAYDGFTEDNQDGGYNVIGANGFERLPAKAEAR